jgi:hypothetical protein
LPVTGLRRHGQFTFVFARHRGSTLLDSAGLS